MRHDPMMAIQADLMRRVDSLAAHVHVVTQVSRHPEPPEVNI